jgi:hypothetical protein
MGKYCIGIDLGGTFIKFGLLDEKRKASSIFQLPTPQDAGIEGVIGQMVAGARQAMHKALGPGGAFFFDQANAFHLASFNMMERYRFDASTCVLSGRHVKRTPDGPVESGWDLRLYHLPELKAMLGGMGFELVKSFGDFGGSAFAADSKRLITVWRKA